MTSQSFRFANLGTWVLIFGLGLAYVSMAEAAEPVGLVGCHPASPPSHHCPPVRTGAPVLPPTPQASQTEPDEPYGILPHHVTIEQKIEKVRKDGKRSGLSPEVIEKIAQDMERGFREEEARPKPTLETGIFPGEAIREQLGTGSSAYYLDENGWFDIVNGKEVSVYAGSMRRDPENDAIQYDPLTVHGFVIIVKGQMGQPGTTVNRIYTPTAVGSLHVVSAKGTVLTLQSRQGNKFLLDIVTEQLTPLGNVALAATKQAEPEEPYGILPEHVTIEQKIEKIRRDMKRRGLSPETIEALTKDMEKDLREYEARPAYERMFTGIVPGDTLAPYPKNYLYESYWFGTVNGREFKVSSGAERYKMPDDTIKYDPLTVHGFVIVASEVLVLNEKGQLIKSIDEKSKQIHTPTEVGSLRIIAAEGNILTLQSRQGNKFLLNVETEQLTPLGAH